MEQTWRGHKNTGYEYMMTATPRPIVFLSYPMTGISVSEREPPYADRLADALLERGILLFSAQRHNPFDNSGAQCPPEIERLVRPEEGEGSTDFLNRQMEAVGRFTCTRMLHPYSTLWIGKRPPGDQSHRLRGLSTPSTSHAIVRSDLYVLSQCVGQICDLSKCSAGVSQEQYAAHMARMPTIGVVPESTFETTSMDESDSSVSIFNLVNCTTIQTVESLFENLDAFIEVFRWKRTIPK